MAAVLSTNGQSTLNGTITGGAGTLVVTSAASFPATGVFHIKIDSEIIRVDSISGATFTVTRGREGTAAAHSDLAVITEDLTWSDLQQLKLDANIIGIAGNTGSTVLGSAFTLNTTTGTYQDTGLSVSLPAAGTYLLFATVTSQIKVTTNTLYTQAKLYNSTDAADVGNPKFIGYQEVTGITVYPNASWAVLVTIAAAKTIKLYANRNFGGTVATSTIEGGATADTSITWCRIA